MNVAVILAGGIGSRVGADIPKQFVEVFGKPIIVYTIEAFENHPEIDAVEIVCVEPQIDYMKELVQKYNLSKVNWITKGGKDFQHSVINGIYNLEDKISNNDIVLVHWAASPFVTGDIISDGIRVAKEKGNAISSQPCYLLYGSNEGDKSTKWIDRDSIIEMGAPQCFSYKYIKELFDEAIEKDLIDKVEPHTTTLMYLMNREIYFSKGSHTNIKITTREDIDFFKAYICGTMCMEKEVIFHAKN